MPEPESSEMNLPDYGGFHPIDPIQEVASHDPFPDTSIVSECTREEVDRAVCKVLAEINSALYTAQIDFEWDEENKIIAVDASLDITLDSGTRIELREQFLKGILLANRECWSLGRFSYTEDDAGTITPLFRREFFVDETIERVDIYFLFEDAANACLCLIAALESILRGDGSPEDLTANAFSFPAGHV